jgi:hypothetical protein
MNPLFVLAGIGAAAYAATVAKGRALPPGQNPFDAFPPGVDATPVGVDLITTTGNRRYKVSRFTHSDGRTYAVAEKKGDVDWLSYFYDPKTESKALWAANADKHEDIDEMKRDFELTGTSPLVYR